MTPTALHPLFGAGEDRNVQGINGRDVYGRGLHPLFGAGEDRNPIASIWSRIAIRAAPALRSG